MPEVGSLRREDPRQLGEYQIEGLLADTGVYAARTAFGDRVAVKVFRSESAQIVGEIQKVRLPDAYHTAQIIDAGVADGLPFIVMEYVDGDPLERVIAEAGPLRGTALHRLAISTMTALVAIHQAGAPHGAFGPDNILLGPDGPRVINTGVAQARAATASQETRRETRGETRSVAYLAPERLTGEPPDPAADMFAWASTMVFAATGRAPVESGSTSATTNRILRDPEVGMLDEHLRGVVADCLAKDPRQRPSAGGVLLKLVGHSLLTAAPGELAAAVPASGAAPAGRRSWRSWRFSALAGAGGLAIAITAAGTVYALRPPPSTPVASAATPSPSVVSLAAVPTPSPPPPPTGRVVVPGVAATLYENPADPVRVAAYRIGGTIYLRTPGSDQFRAIGEKAEEMAASPDGAWLALLGSGTLTVINRASGEKFTVAVGSVGRPTWSRDGRRLLLTAPQGAAVDVYGLPLPSGFTIIDVATRKATTVDTEEESRQGRGQYSWLPDGTGLAVTYQTTTPTTAQTTTQTVAPTARDYGMRIRDLTGRQTRTLHWVGYTGGGRMFSPSGKLFVTTCPSGGSLCVWDLAEGVRRASVAIFFENFEFWGWYDENHLLVLDPSAEPYQLVAMDLRGQVRRVLLTVAGEDYADLRVTLARR